MALPATLNPAAPLSGAAFSTIDDEIRALKQFLVDVYGFQTTTTAPAFTMTSGGVLSVSQSVFNTKSITSAMGTVATDSPNFNVTGTWNNSGVTFNGIKANITDTASAAASRLLALQTDSTDRFIADKSGAVTTGAWNATPVSTQYGGMGQDFSASTGVPLIDAGTAAVSSGTNSQLITGSTGAVPVWAMLNVGQSVTIPSILAGSAEIGSRLDKVEKASDQTQTTTSTTPASDNSLVYSFNTPGFYLFTLNLLITSANNTMDFRCTWSGVSFQFGEFLNNSTLATSGNVDVNTVSGLNGIELMGIFWSLGPASATATFQWSKATGSAGDLTVHKNSTLKVLLIS